MIAFLDTNVLMDVLAQRVPFLQDSLAVWYLAEKSEFYGFVSAISFNNIAYIFRKMGAGQRIKQALTMIRDTFQIVPLDQQILDQAIEANWKDFEDAIQYFSALRAGASSLVTRNTPHFPTGELAIETPSQFLAAHFPK